MNVLFSNWKSLRDWQTWCSVTGNSLIIRRGRLAGFVRGGMR